MTKFLQEWGFEDGPMAHQNKSKMAAAAIFNFGKNINNSGLDKDIYTKFHGKTRRWPRNQKLKPDVNLRDVI